MQYVIENDTGKIVEICTEGTDVSRFDTTVYTIITDPNEYDMSLYYYDFVNNTFALYDAGVLFSEAQKEKYMKLIFDYNAYIEVDCGYPTAWQNEAQVAIKHAEDTLKNADSTQDQIDAANAILTALNSVEYFITSVVRTYFSNKRDEIFATTTQTELDSVTWDFKTLDTYKPNVRMTTDVYPYWDIIKPPPTI